MTEFAVHTDASAYGPAEVRYTDSVLKVHALVTDAERAGIDVKATEFVDGAGWVDSPLYAEHVELLDRAERRWFGSHDRDVLVEARQQAREDRMAL